MSIQYKTKCLIQAVKEGEVDILAHQANCFNTMNSGIAKAIRINFPEMYEADCATVKGDTEKFGKFSSATLTFYLAKGYNLYGQFRYGADRQYTNYEKLEEALEAMAKDLQDFPATTKIGIPKLGCGSARGSWEIVSKLVEKHLGLYQVTVYSLDRGDEV